MVNVKEKKYLKQERRWHGIAKHEFKPVTQEEDKG
jgi:hypothetical protein